MVPRALHSLPQHETTVVLNCVYAHQLYHDIFCACVSKVCPKVSEKAKGGNFGGLGMSKNFSINVN